MQPVTTHRKRRYLSRRFFQASKKKLKKEGSTASSFIEISVLWRIGVSVEQQKWHVEIEFSMQRHNHMYKNLHTAMLKVWRKMNPAQESDVEKQLKTQNRTQSTSHLVQH